jgi:DNA-directed RNA polymerase subunit omega
MAKAADATAQAEEQAPAEQKKPIDSKYRLILVAAQRSKQLQKGARPRVEMDTQRHKPTRIALEEVQRGQVEFSITDEE